MPNLPPFRACEHAYIWQFSPATSWHFISCTFTHAPSVIELGRGPLVIPYGPLSMALRPSSGTTLIVMNAARPRLGLRRVTKRRRVYHAIACPTSAAARVLLPPWVRCLRGERPLEPTSTAKLPLHSKASSVTALESHDHACSGSPCCCQPPPRPTVEHYCAEKLKSGGGSRAPSKMQQPSGRRDAFCG